jgi:hypothetical protein
MCVERQQATEPNLSRFCASQDGLPFAVKLVSYGVN